MRKQTTFALFISLSIILLILTACGGSGDSTEESATSPTTEPTEEVTQEPTPEPEPIEEATPETTAEATESVDAFSAQQNEACPELVRVALAQVIEVCDATGRNQICYGNTSMEFTPREAIEDIVFGTPGDVTEIANLQTIQLSPMDTVNSQWGIALMRLQANLEGTLGGQNVTFLLFGDVQLENLGTGDDGVQSFYFQSAVGDAQCSEAPESGMLVQTPEGVAQVNLNINNVDIALGSTAFIQAQPEQEMRISMVEGQAIVTAGGESKRVFAGTETTVALDETGYAEGTPSDPEPYSLQPLQSLPVAPLERQFSISQPTRISETDTRIGFEVIGMIDEPGEVITYNFDANAGQTIYLEAQSGDGTQVNWRLEDRFGNTLLDTTGIDQSLGLFTFEQEGNYSVIVASRNEGTSNYQFKIWEVAQPESFEAHVGPADETNRRVYSGTLTTPGSSTVYTFDVQAGQTVFFDSTGGDGGSIHWEVRDADDNMLIDLQRFDLDAQYTFEETGTYSIVVFSVGDGSGEYAFKLWDVPQPETRDYTIGETIRDSIATPGQIRGYNFVATEGQVLFLESLEGNGEALHWELKHDSGDVIFSESPIDIDLGEFVVPADGSYLITVSGAGDGVGAYAIQIWDTIIQPDDFVVDLGEVIRGSINAGDSLEFTLTLEDEITLHFASQGQLGGSFVWALQNANGEVIFENMELWNGNDGEYTLPIGEYIINVSGMTGEDAGLYQFQIWDANAVDLFDYDIGQLVEDGASGDGSGIIEQAGEVDRYTFTLDEDDNIVFIGLSITDDVSFVMSLYYDTGDQIFENVGIWYGNQLEPIALPAGTYTLDVTGASGDVGAYSFQAWRLLPPDYFEIGIGTIVADGEPLAGAGNIETPGAIDSYLLILQEDADVSFLSQNETDSRIFWSLYDLNDEPIFEREGLWFGNDLGPFVLQAGAYSIQVQGEANNTGTYQFEITGN